jgi:hypothetical protein
VLAAVALAVLGWQSAPLAAAAPPTSPPAAAPTAVPSPAAFEPLPRAAAGVGLGMRRAEVQAQLGNLTCHDNPAGFQVCNGSPAGGAAARNLEVYFHRGRVLSLAYDEAVPSDAWTLLDALVRRHGTPTLSGLTERDQQGRLHEIYGWRDAQTLCSLRFVWEEQGPNPRRLTATTVTVWDRKAYEAWEREQPRREAPGGATPALAATPDLTAL